MSRGLTQARRGSGDHVLAPRWAIAVVLQRNPELVSRHCTPVACDVQTRAYLYDVDEAEAVLAARLRRSKPRQKS